MSIQLSACVSITDTVRVVNNSLAGITTLKPINVFTPNNDGINDKFGFKDIIGSEFHFEVYDRWGELVFKTTDSNVQWDGTSNKGICSDGVYYWIAQFKREAACNNAIVINKGFITLVR